MLAAEAPLEPGRPIIDSHLHMWDLRALLGDLGPDFAVPTRFLPDEVRATIVASGHAITHTVHVDCFHGYRTGGPAELRCVGETETVTALAEAAARAGGVRLGERIVASADLLLGAAVRPVLEAHVAAGGARFRGVRMPVAWSEAGLHAQACPPETRHRLRDPQFRAGAAALAAMDLSLDVWCLHSQLAELIELADALPELAIVLDHIGTPEIAGIWAGQAETVRRQWLAAIGELARRPNVVVKLGGMGMNIAAPFGAPAQPLGSEALAARWRPWIEPCIAAFGVERAMFESNFPPDATLGTYGATWNAFKRVVAGASDDEKDWLFRRTAARIYRIELG